MSTTVTAEEVLTGATVLHDKHLCHITKKVKHKDGSYFIQWTENFFGREAECAGSFSANSLFGEETCI